jgi:hypothetical protein
MHALEQLAEAFIKRRPNQVTFDKKSERPWVLLRVTVEPVPLRIATVAGDAVQNLRSALDHLAWQVVLSEGQEPGRHTAFPIYMSENDFERRVRDPPKNRPGPLHGIDPSGEKWAVIERFQPYREGPPLLDPLGAIGALSNADKHRSLLAGHALVDAFDIHALTEVTGLEIEEFKTSIEPLDVLTHDAEIARFRPTAIGEMSVKRELPFQISLSDGGPETPEEEDWVVVPVRQFDRLRSHVVRIIRTLEPLLAE